MELRRSSVRRRTRRVGRMVVQGAVDGVIGWLQVALRRWGRELTRMVVVCKEPKRQDAASKGKHLKVAQSCVLGRLCRQSREEWRPRPNEEGYTALHRKSERLWRSAEGISWVYKLVMGITFKPFKLPLFMSSTPHYRRASPEAAGAATAPIHKSVSTLYT